MNPPDQPLSTVGLPPLADAVGGAVNRLLSYAGLMITRAAPGQFESWRPYIGGPYRSDREVIRLARQQGISVGDFIEAEWGHPGRARRTMARMRSAGAVPQTGGTVCEIGPGSGRYVEALLEIASPARYEICEIEKHRARWLARTYPVVIVPTSGEALPRTPKASVDLLHAHGVFASLKVISCFAYFEEFARITAPGGHVVFDVIDEACLSDPEVDGWLATPLRYVNVLSKPQLVQYFGACGFSLVDEFREPLMVFGRSLYLVFKKLSG